MYTLTSLTTPGGSSSPRVTFSISFSSSFSQRVNAVLGAVHRRPEALVHPLVLGHRRAPRQIVEIDLLEEVAA